MNIKKLRNIGIIAHVDAGKTTLTERILYFSGKEHHSGDTHSGTAKMDYRPDEQSKGITIVSAATSIDWQGHKITIIDTPGHIDFNIEVNRSLRVLDGAVVVFDGVAGVEPQSETNWQLADNYAVPRICFVNKLDRGGADFYQVVAMIRERLTEQTVITHLPIGREADFSGVLDVIEQQALYWDQADGKQIRIAPIPEAMRQTAQHYRQQLIESVIEYDEQALTDYLAGKAVDNAALYRCLRNATVQGQRVPVLCGAAYKYKGVQPLLDAVVKYLPSPAEAAAVAGMSVDGETEVYRHNDVDEPFAALVFKIVNDKHGSLTFIRAYSGILKAGDSVINTVSGKKERISRIYAMHAMSREERAQISAGDIVAVIGLKHSSTGDTLCDANAPVVLENMQFPEPVIDVALEPKTRADQDRLMQSLHSLVKEDPSLRSKVNAETGETILSGMGELHLEIKIAELLREYKVAANVGAPQVAYRETIAAGSQLRHRLKKQDGGPGMFAEIEIRLEPLARGDGIEFVSEISDGMIPKAYIPAVEKGIRAGAQCTGKNNN